MNNQIKNCISLLNEINSLTSFQALTPVIESNSGCSAQPFPEPVKGEGTIKEWSQTTWIEGEIV